MPRTATKPKRQRQIRRNYVAKLRERAGFSSQDKLAEAMGVSQGTISKIEAHSVPITVKNEALLVAALGLANAADLYENPDAADLNREARGLPDADIVEIIALIRAKRQRHSL